MGAKNNFSSIDIIRKQLTRHRYISDQSLATVLYLSYHLSKPIFLEGEPGVGKTEVALVLADILCHETHPTSMLRRFGCQFSPV